MGNIYITGDKHGDYKEVEDFCLKWNTSKDDLLIVLGDNGVNYYGEKKDRRIKNWLTALPISFFMIRGNHDQRPSKKLYTKKTDAHPLVRGECLVEEEYPTLLFAKEFGEYEFMTGDSWKSTFVIGGAYSVDKYYRLEMQAAGYHQYRWFYDEQLSEAERNKAYKMASCHTYDYIMTHTCPQKYVPYDKFIGGIDQDGVDTSTEEWLDKIEEAVPYSKWFCGHYHIDRGVDNVRFMYHDVMSLGGQQLWTFNYST